jgi:aryl-alcohol dehydrogenase-like predicted oxidoreductase
MEYRRLGRSGLTVSAIGLGTITFGNPCDAEASAAIVHAALDLGMTFIDTADIYGRGPSAEFMGRAEEFIGRAIRGRRHEAVIATKGSIRFNESSHWSDTSRHYLLQAAEASLRRLGTDYIDLYQVHLPDPKTPIAETLRVLDDLVRSGKVRYVACVNYRGWQLVDAAWTAHTEHLSPFISSQNRYNLLDRGAEAEILPACERFGLGFIPFLPLAGGLLTGKYRSGQPPPDGARLVGSSLSRQVPLTEQSLASVSRLETVARERGHTLLELAISWLLARPAVGSIITGATSPAQVKANASAADWTLTTEDFAAVDAALMS